MSFLDNQSLLGRLLRRPLSWISPTMVIRIVTGPNSGHRWIVGASTHGCWLGCYEREKQHQLKRLVKPGDCVVDVEANVGFYTLLASRLVGPTGRVIAFEPLPRNLAFIRRHLELNRINNVTVIEAAVSDHDGSGSFVESADPSMGHLTNGKGVPVKLITLDSLYKRGELASPRLVKIDVEGAEASVLRGMRELIADLRPVLLLAGHSTHCQSDCESVLAQLDYQLDVQRDGSIDGMYESIAYPAATTLCRP